jgi:hypothetical protein
LLPLLLYEKAKKKEQNMKMVVEIVVTGLRKRRKKAHFIYQFKIFLFNPPKKRNNP